ncbi:RagB/SusD family nutrient uptake outer membrane protein [Niabella drilacis]|uniref:Carbohydrate binding domain-containing protein n=1 Tax=Niabella drilacis (strain DSM 25811 / CCM 8410 / CCUG 62505 / LMG 26954 / E90) TaxID=1285928 RepID=A0A1G6M4B4_NIADE|nr:RagB/SusD family nutrient uptake outer membrane protein [Niabella drilacis]SDC50378.1 Carbohydrate binding domain-containing protein [Niabella drilacis]
MKKIFIIIALALTVASCKRDPLDITPDGRMSLEDVFTSEIQTEAYLNTVYASIPSYFNNYAGWSFLAGLTDEAQDAEIGNLSASLAAAWITGSLTPGNNPLAQAGGIGGGQNRYTTFWAGIRDANVFLGKAPDVMFANPNRKARIIAEARLLRAFFYFELVKQFGPMPIITEPFSPTFDYSQLKRPTFQECTDFIAEECARVIAEGKLPVRITQESERGRFTLAVAYVLRSEALLYNASPLWNPANDLAKWNAAAAAAKEGIDALTVAGYELVNDYGNYFLNTSDLADNPRDRETIFEIKTGEIPLTTTGLPSKQGSWMLGATPSQELVDAYDMKETGEPAILGYEDADHLKPIINGTSGYDEQNPYKGRDPRFYATLWYNGAAYDNINGQVHIVETFIGGADQLIKSPPNRINTHTGYYLRKFIDPKLAINQTSSAKFKKYRLAELYLNLAEAENEANGPTSRAYDAVNVIRKRAKMPDMTTGLDQTQFRDRVRRERRVELVWEEHRFWDVRRWKILSQTDKLVTGMEIKAGAGAGTVTVPNPSFESGESGWTFYTGASVVARAGHTSEHVVSIADGGHIWTTISGLQPNTTYEVSLLMYVESGSGYVGVRNYGGNEVSTPAVPADGVKEQKVQFTTGAANTTADIFSWWPNGSKGLLDDFSIIKKGGGSQPAPPANVTYTRFVTERRNAWQDKFLIFPIPLSDASIIPDFTKNQNPGW